MRLLVVARKFDSNFPNIIGGVIVSSENLFKYLDATGVDYCFVDTNKGRLKYRFFSFFSINYSIFKKIPNVDHVALNLNEMELILIAPFAVFFSCLLGKRVSLRVFGGNFDVFHNSSWFRKRIINYVLSKCCLLFLQTKHLVAKYKTGNIVVHLPTCRYLDVLPSINEYKKKFIFIGQIKHSKGVGVILDAINELNDMVVDFYGPLVDFSENDLNTNCSNYCGIVNHEDTVNLLSGYDFLLFPTFHEGEGYPGIIFESYAAGTPVITTKWRSIPEIVDDGKTGFLIEPEDVYGLKEIISNIDSSNYTKMRKSSFEKFKKFNCKRVYRKYINKITEYVN